MRSGIAAALIMLLLAGCGGGGSDAAELNKKTEDLARRVKALEEQMLEADKKLIRHQQALQTMHERVRDMEAQIDRARMGTR